MPYVLVVRCSFLEIVPQFKNLSLSPVQQFVLQDADICQHTEDALY